MNLDQRRDGFSIYFKGSDDEERVQGWSYSKSDICAKCLDDPHLRSVVEANAEHQKCDFWGAKGREAHRSAL